MGLKCIPLNLEWCGDTKQDFFAIYARRKQDNWGVPELDAQGREQWDATGPLPMRRHPDWMKKGYVYVTLWIRRDDHRWPLVAGWIRQSTGEDPETYIQNRRERTTFDSALWMQDAAKERAAELARLRDQVAKFGAEAVVEIRRQTDPSFTLPADLSATDVTDEPPSPPERRGPGRPRKTEVAA